MSDLYALLRPVLAPPIRWSWQGRVEGDERIPAQGPLLVAANHASYVDFLLLSAVLPRQVTFLAKHKLFASPRWGWLMRATGQIRVGSAGAAREACLALRRHVEDGRLIGIFPEGTRSRDGRPGRFHDTVIKLSRRHEVPVLPVHLSGTREAWAPGDPLPKRRRCDVSFGAPYLPDGDLAEETARLRERILELGRRGPD